MAAHVEEVVKKVRRRYWILRHLAAFGFNCNDLIMVYKSMIRSVIEFASVVYHSLLTADQAAQLERLQRQALVCVYGSGESYSVMLAKAGIEKLSERRENACLKFAKKCIGGKFSSWFPRKEGREGLRTVRPYKESFARCDRLKNTPIFYMRRKLNEEAAD
jgi:hypothetical protein